MTNTHNDITRLLSHASLDEALAWLLVRRNDCPDVRAIQRDWPAFKTRIRAQILHGHYQFSPLRVFSVEGGTVGRWTAEDALLIKALSNLLQWRLRGRFNRVCYSVAGGGGMKAACRTLNAKLCDYRYCFKSDVANYYYSINHHLLLCQLEKNIHDKRLIRLVGQCLNRVEVYQAEHRLVYRGICKGCSLSPLLGNLYLLMLDQTMEKRGCTMIRFMDDFIILTKTRHQLRRAIKDVYTVLKTLELHLAKAKTYIGPIARGFDFLGYHFSPHGLGVGKKSVSRMREKVLRLYERGACATRIEGYLTHWMRWLKAGLKGRIESALEPLLLTIHSIQQKIKFAQRNRLHVEQVATLILA